MSNVLVHKVIRYILQEPDAYAKCHQVLKQKWGISFNYLVNFANVPLCRFRQWLLDSGNLEKYIEKLASNFNPCAVKALMYRTLVKATFLSCQYPNLETLMSECLSQLSIEIDRERLSVAGPVVSGQARITSLPSIIDEVRM
jgi:hypothetical protein